MKEHAVSIWYLIGQLMVVYGILIGGAGIYYCFYPTPEHLVLGHLHVDLWWGAFMLVLGFFYIAKFKPTKANKL